MGAIPIFFAIIFGQLEAGLSQPYPAAQPVLNFRFFGDDASQPTPKYQKCLGLKCWKNYAFTVRLVLQSEDVLHGFYVPEFRIKQDIIPNRTIIFVFKPRRIGKYRLRNSQFSGTNFALMEANVYVEPETIYSQWLTQISILSRSHTFAKIEK